MLPVRPDVDGDLLQLGHRRRRRELERDRPARLAADHAEPPLGLDVVDLHDHAVDLVVEVLAPLLPFAERLHDALEAIRARTRRGSP